MSSVGAIWWLERQDGGVRVRIHPGGVLFGRHLGCNVILDTPHASKRHALVRIGLDGPELLPLGRNVTLVNDEPVTGPVHLEAGDRIQLPGDIYIARVEGDKAPHPSGSTWVIEGKDGWVYAPHSADYTIGSGLSDTVYLPRWPPAALRLQHLYYSAVATLGVPMNLDGEQHPAGMMVSLKGRMRFELAGTAIELLQDSESTNQTTFILPEQQIARRMSLSFLPNGALFEAEFVGQPSRGAPLSELRGRMMATLMSARNGYKPGEILTDDEMIASVWPRLNDKTNHEVNTLVYRTRQALVAAGIDPFLIFERLKHGGGTRLLLDERTELEVN